MSSCASTEIVRLGKTLVAKNNINPHSSIYFLNLDLIMFIHWCFSLLVIPKRYINTATTTKMVQKCKKERISLFTNNFIPKDTTMEQSATFIIGMQTEVRKLLLLNNMRLLNIYIRAVIPRMANSVTAT